MSFSTYLETYSKEFGIHLSTLQIEKLTTFYHLVVAKNEVMNLTAITEPKEFVLKHIIDSLSCYDSHFEGSHKKVLDLGTGAGFPGIPLGIYDESLEITLFDSLKKRLTFLDDVTKTLKVSNFTTLHGRAEDMGHRELYREQFHIVTSRAVARLPVLLEWALPYVQVGGYFIALKGGLASEELADSKRALTILGGLVDEVKKVTLPTLIDEREIIYIKKVKPTPPKYPRRPKDIKEKTL